MRYATCYGQDGRPTSEVHAAELRTWIGERVLSQFAARAVAAGDADSARMFHAELQRRALECDRPSMIDCERYETDRPRREHIAPGGRGIDNGWAEDSRKGVRHA